jgi:hypothetical protein
MLRDVRKGLRPRRFHAIDNRSRGLFRCAGNVWLGSHRQDYIDIDLRNGDTMSPSPTNQANRFKDKKGHKVVRTGAANGSSGYQRG